MLLKTPRDSQIKAKVNLMLQVDQLKDLPPVWLHRLAEEARWHTYFSREVLFRQNQLIEAAVIVLKGELALYQYFDAVVPYPKLCTIRIKKQCDLKHDNLYHTQTKLFKRLSKLVDDRLETPQGQKRLVKKVGPHQVVGFEAVGQGSRVRSWMYEAVAVQPTRCLLINKQVFEQLERLEEGEEPLLLTALVPPRISFAELVDEQIRNLQAQKRRRQSLPARHKPHRSKSLNFLSKLYRKGA